MTNSPLITDKQTLRKHVGEPEELALAAIKTSMDKFHKMFIQQSPFFCLATSSQDGETTVSPRGDAPGFIRIIDDRRLLFPDRFGNNKVESFSNIVTNPQVGLIFFVPGIRETLRVSGTAQITRDTALLEFGKVNETLPRSATLVEISRVYFHCGKAIIRSRLWDHKRHLSQKDFPTFIEILKEQTSLDVSEEEGQKILDNEYKNKLY